MADEWNTVVASGGSVTLPDAVCTRLGWAPGTVLRVRQTEEGLLLTSVPMEARGDGKSGDQGTEKFVPITAVMRAINPGVHLPPLKALHRPRADDSARKGSALSRAVKRSVEHRDMLMAMAGEMMSSSQVEDLLGIKRQAIDKRRNGHKLLAVRMGSSWSYPAFQFTGGNVLPGLEDILRANADMDPSVIIDILLTPDDALRGRTLLQAMKEGDTPAVERYIAQAEGDGFA